MKDYCLLFAGNWVEFVYGRTLDFVMGLMGDDDCQCCAGGSSQVAKKQ